MGDTETAILDWIHTFDAGKGCQQIQELSDGIILADILHEMCPDFFEVVAMHKATDGNWALAAGNIRTLLRSLDDYFRTVLGKSVDLSGVEANAIAKGGAGEGEAILPLVELVVGVAVMCERKAEFIRDIFLLNPDSQAVLKEMVEHVLGRASDLEEEEGEGAGEGEEAEGQTAGEDKPQPSNAEEELIRTRELLLHLQNERQRLLNDLRNSEIAADTLRAQVSSLREKSSLSEAEKAAADGNERQRQTAAEVANSRLAKELDETKKDLDERLVEVEGLKAELRLAQQRLESSREIQAKLEMENHQQADELDVARDKLQKLSKAEQSVEKYQKKLEEMLALKKTNKELNDKMDHYLDKIHELESTNKSLGNLNKMIENYKNRAIELEREKFEAISNAEIFEQQLQQANKENAKLLEAKNRLEDEVLGLRSQVQLLEEEKEEEERKGFSGLGLEEEESLPQLREKVRKLERQLASQSHATSSGETSGALAILQQELEEVKAIKKEREDSLMAAKKQLAELQGEVARLQKGREEEKTAADNSQAVKELSQKLAATSNTVKLLEERLKERETAVNKLQQEKAKLENYAKRSLDTFKEKYVTVVKTMQQEKKELVEKIRVQAERQTKNQDTWRREERLLSSALFEVGVKIMDRKIQSQLNEPLPLQQNTFLSLQREALAKSAADPNRLQQNNATTPFTSPK